MTAAFDLSRGVGMGSSAQVISSSFPSHSMWFLQCPKNSVLEQDLQPERWSVIPSEEQMPSTLAVNYKGKHTLGRSSAS